MIVNIFQPKETNKVLFIFTPEKDDVDCARSMNNNHFQVQVPQDFLLNRDVHPDLLCLICIFATLPYFTKRIVFPYHVSNHFKQVFFKKFKKEIVSDGSVQKRVSPKKNCRPGLAFSGGVDSVTALTLMPKNTLAVFLNRKIPFGYDHPTLYKNDAALASCNALKNHGYNIEVIDSTYEYIRFPVGFVVDLSQAIPLLLLADYYNIDSVGYGMILESAYNIGRGLYLNWFKRKMFMSLSDCMDAVDLPLFMPTIGMSECLTSKISQDLSHLHPQSCIRGLVDQPCMKCFKCYRKTMLSSALSGHYTDQSLDSWFGFREVNIKMTKSEIFHHEGVTAYALKRYKGKMGKLTEMIKNLIIQDDTDYSYLERWYPRSIDAVPEQYRQSFIESVNKVAPTMNDNDMKELESFDLADFSEQRRTMFENFVYEAKKSLK